MVQLENRPTDLGYMAGIIVRPKNRKLNNPDRMRRVCKVFVTI